VTKDRGRKNIFKVNRYNTEKANGLCERQYSNTGWCWKYGQQNSFRTT